VGCRHGLCVLVSPGAFDLSGDLIDGVAGVFEFEIDGLVVMTAMILQCLHEVFGEVGVTAQIKTDQNVRFAIIRFLPESQFAESKSSLCGRIHF